MSHTKRTEIIRPKRPMAEPKISTIRILTKSEASAASARAAPEPTWPTHRPQTRLTTPVVRPAPNMRYPAIQFLSLMDSSASAAAWKRSKVTKIIKTN